MSITKISVIIPAYNCAQYIIETIESVKAQTYPYIEIIIVDDGSTDNTLNIIRPYISNNSIKYFRQSNKGPSSARNRGILLSTGDVIAFLDADDHWLPDKLQQSIDFMEQSKFDWICTSMVKEMPNGGSIIKAIPPDSWVLNYNTKEIKQLKKGLFFFSDIPVHTPTIVARKKCFDKAGLFDESILIGEDTDLWLRFEEMGFAGGYLDKPLTIYRYNPNSITKRRKVDGLREHCKVAKKHALLLGIRRFEIRKTYSDFLWHTADIYFSEKNYYGCLKCIVRSVFYDWEKFKKIGNKLCQK